MFMRVNSKCAHQVRPPLPLDPRRSVNPWRLMRSYACRSSDLPNVKRLGGSLCAPARHERGGDELAAYEQSDHEQIDWMTPEGENRDPLNDNTLTQEAVPIRELSAPELNELLASGAAIELVDVRTDHERAIAALDGSRLLDQAYHDALLLRDRATPIVFLCHHGIRSQHAAEYFRRQGFRNLYNLSGGIDAWSALVDPSVPRY